jgi:uncharacterized protein YkwD
MVPLPRRSAAGSARHGGTEYPPNVAAPRPLTPAMTRTALTLAAVLTVMLAPAASAAPRLNASELEVIQRLNDVRTQNGLAALKPARGLNRAADRHSRDMLVRDFFDHPSSDGTPFDRRVRRYAKAGMVGETLASLPDRHGGAETVVRIWMDSAAHRAIVLDARLTRIGIGRRWGTLGSTPTAVVTADFAS